MKRPEKSGTFTIKSMNATQMPEPKRKIRDILDEAQEVVQDRAAPKTDPPAAVDVVQEEELTPVSWRVPRTLLGEFVEFAAKRKASRKRPWKHQDLFAEALREYLDRNSKK
jgi:hypothetical protein